MSRKQLTCNSCVFYGSFYEAVSLLPLESQGKVYDAIFKFAFENIEVDLEGVELAVFLLIKPQLIANRTKYENGCKGGRPKKEESNQKHDENRDIVEEEKSFANQNETEEKPSLNKNTADKNSKQHLNKTEEKPKRNLSETKTKPNENDNVNDNVNDNENVNDNYHHLPLTPSYETNEDSDDEDDNSNSCGNEEAKRNYFYDLVIEAIDELGNSTIVSSYIAILRYIAQHCKRVNYVNVNGGNISSSNYLQVLMCICREAKEDSTFVNEVFAKISCQQNITNMQKYIMSTLYNNSQFRSLGIS